MLKRVAATVARPITTVGNHSLGVFALCLLLLGAADWGLTSGFLVHDELGVALVPIPLETSEIGVF